jgi:hypothetical protein
VVGSKFEGTGFEKLQIGHTHVAAPTEGAAGCRKGLSALGAGDALLDLEGPAASEAERVDIDDRFEGLGISVILGEDFKNLA